VHSAALLVSEYFPGRHATQRSGVFRLLSDSYCPGVHATFALQNGWPLLGWYLLAGQAVHAWALVVSEYLSAGHSWHLVSSRLLLSDSNCPGMHCTLTSQNGWPLLSWYLLAGHAVQTKLAFEN
jgi:prepilin signal peptidase PulO-like enzyme (type II secretory pathway)